MSYVCVPKYSYFSQHRDTIRQSVIRYFIQFIIAVGELNFLFYPSPSDLKSENTSTYQFIVYTLYRFYLHLDFLHTVHA